jgi:hypothetical protein
VKSFLIKSVMSYHNSAPDYVSSEEEELPPMPPKLVRRDSMWYDNEDSGIYSIQLSGADMKCKEKESCGCSKTKEL